MSRNKWIAAAVAALVVIGIFYSQSGGSAKVAYPTWRPTVGRGPAWAPYKGGSGRPGAQTRQLGPSHTVGPGKLLAGGCRPGGGCCHACS